MIGVSGLGLFDGADRIETLAGEHRTVELADGSKIEINGASVVEIDADRPRFARRESGEAMFHVVHRDDDPFVVATGGAKIVDLGTALNVVRRDRHTPVAVSASILPYTPDRDKVRPVTGTGRETHDGHRPTPEGVGVDVGNESE